MKKLSAAFRCKRGQVLRRLGLLITLFCCGVLLSPAHAQPKVLLASDGRAAMPVIVSKSASAKTRAVAAELAEYLQRISGAKFEVRDGDGTTGIVLGTLAEFPHPELAPALQICDIFDGREAYAIHTEPQRLLLLGARELGASHAAFRLLETLGCRWYFPAPEWEIIPSISKLEVSLRESDRPAVLSRRIWYAWGFIRDAGQSSSDSRAASDYAAWARRNRMAQSLQVNTGHAWQNIIAQNKEAFATHPEYLALVDGKRRGPQLCVSNAGLQKLVADYALDYFEKNPKADMVSVDPADGGGHCQCEECRKLGSVSDRVFGLANSTARVVREKHPGKMVGLYAYNYHSEPPSFELEPNVYVQLTTSFTTGEYSFGELLKLWPQRAKTWGIYDYFSVYLWDFDRLPGGQAANVASLAKNVKRYAERGASSIDAESGNNWGPHGRGYYVANKVMWNPDADVDALLSDFYEKAFGPAAAAIKRYYNRFDGSERRPMLTPGLLGTAYRDVQEASTLATNRPDVQARLNHIKHYLHFTYLDWQLARADKTQKKALTLELLTHLYRTRYAYMNHWEAFRQKATVEAAKDFNEPSWSFKEKTPEKPWMVETAYSAAEIEHDFQAGLEFFQPQEVNEKTFSSDLVPVIFEEHKASGAALTFQDGPEFAFYSLQGGPIEVEVIPGTITYYRNRPDAMYSLRSSTGEVVASGTLKLDGEKHSLKLEVPAAGVYNFEFNDSKAGWRITLSPDQPAALLLQRNVWLPQTGKTPEQYFYVPKGTRQIEYFWNGGPHQVIDPSGQVAQEVNTKGEYVIVPVPAGMDGSVWRLSKLKLGSLWFFNVPNQLSLSPRTLLIPREVAEKDGLVIAR